MIAKTKLFLLTLSLFPFMLGEAWAAAAGTVILSNGQFSATGAGGGQRTLSRGSEINAGDVLVTGADSSAQVRFSDNSIISLSPNTRYRVDSYKYQAATPSKSNYSATILKGGVKTLTGKIAKENYSVKSPVATIGVRGTFFGVAYDEQGQSTTTWQGAVVMKNDAGSITLGPGERVSSASVSSASQAPQGSSTESDQLVSNLNEKGFESLQQRIEATNNILFNVPTPIQLQEPLNPSTENIFQPTNINNQIDFFTTPTGSPM